MTDTKRIFLWTIPRTVSTAFQISISTLPGTKTIHEPYNVAYHTSNPYRESVPFTGLNYSFEEATEVVRADYPGKTAVFVKDFSFAVRGRFEMFLHESFTHSFLIRNPKRVIMSYYKLLEDNLDYFRELCERGEVGFQELRDFYFFLKSRLNVDPVIIDSDDLLANPEKMMESYCERVGLTYKQGMTKWDAGSGWDPNYRDQMQFSGKTWGDLAIESSGFKDPTPLPTLPDDIPTEYTECMEECFKPYNELYSLRMTV